jgi:endogenous inhibitor of DNA gyrase (YacG/DUF329 family)
MRCPICRKEVALADPYMPFCSERCKLIDLGNWASEKYTISSPITADKETPTNSDEAGSDKE